MLNTTADIVLDVIRRRRSYKVAALKPDTVDRALIDRILEAGRWAPSHGQTEPWRFTVFAGDARAALGRAFGEAYTAINRPTGKFQQAAFESQRDRVQLAPVWIGLGMQPGVNADGKPAMPIDEELAAVACAVQNIHLMTAALGMGGQWTSNAVATHPVVADLMGLTAPGRSLGFFFLGHLRDDAPQPPAKRRPAEERVRWM